MEKYLNILEEPSSATMETDEQRLRFLNSKVKVLEYAGISLGVYKNLSLEDRSSFLMSYYKDLNGCFPVAGKF